MAQLADHAAALTAINSTITSKTALDQVAVANHGAMLVDIIDTVYRKSADSFTDSEWSDSSIVTMAAKDSDGNWVRANAQSALPVAAFRLEDGNRFRVVPGDRVSYSVTNLNGSTASQGQIIQGNTKVGIAAIVNDADGYTVPAGGADPTDDAVEELKEGTQIYLQKNGTYGTNPVNGYDPVLAVVSSTEMEYLGLPSRKADPFTVGLVAHYCDGTCLADNSGNGTNDRILDISGNGHHVSCNGEPVGEHNNEWIAVESLECTGPPIQNILGSDTTGEFTVMCWAIRRADVGGSNSQLVVSWGDGSPNGVEFGIGFDKNTDRPRCVAKPDGSTGDSYFGDENDAPEDLTWAFLEFRYDGTNLEFYVDGRLWHTGAHAAFARSGNLIIGGLVDSSGTHQTCDVAFRDLKIFNRALTDAELVEHRIYMACDSDIEQYREFKRSGTFAYQAQGVAHDETDKWRLRRLTSQAVGGQKILTSGAINCTGAIGHRVQSWHLEQVDDAKWTCPTYLSEAFRICGWEYRSSSSDDVGTAVSTPASVGATSIENPYSVAIPVGDTIWVAGQWDEREHAATWRASSDANDNTAGAMRGGPHRVTGGDTSSTSFMPELRESIPTTDLFRQGKVNSTIAFANLASGHSITQVLDQVDFTTAEPGSPSNGDTYINTITGTSSGTSQSVTANRVYTWNGSTWTESTPSTDDKFHVDSGASVSPNAVLNWSGSSYVTTKILTVHLDAWEVSQLRFYDGTNYFPSAGTYYSDLSATSTMAAALNTAYSSTSVECARVTGLSNRNMSFQFIGVPMAEASDFTISHMDAPQRVIWMEPTSNHNRPPVGPVSIKGVRLTRDSGSTVAHLFTAHNAKDVTIEDCHTDGDFGYFGTIGRATNVTIKHCTGGKPTTGGTIVAGAGAGSWNVLWDQCVFFGGLNAFDVVQGGRSPVPVGLEIVNCDLSGSNGAPCRAHGAGGTYRNCKITSNNVASGQECAVLFEGYKNQLIGCEVWFTNTSGVAAFRTTGGGGIIRDNKIYSVVNGIGLGSSGAIQFATALVKGNELYYIGSGTGDGIICVGSGGVQACTDAMVDGNYIQDYDQGLIMHSTSTGNNRMINNTGVNVNTMETASNGSVASPHFVNNN